jgi:hypothetical protein
MFHLNLVIDLHRLISEHDAKEQNINLYLNESDNTFAQKNLEFNVLFSSFKNNIFQP